MLDAANLINLGLSSQLVSVWQVFPYIALVIICLMMQRVKLCLLFTYLFTYYLAFLTYWGEYIMNAKSLMPFFVYAICGLAIVVLYLLASFRETSQAPSPAAAKAD